MFAIVAILILGFFLVGWLALTAVVKTVEGIKRRRMKSYDVLTEVQQILATTKHQRLR